MTNRSFAQIASNALLRAGKTNWELRERVLTRARLADAKTKLGAHPMHSRATDRRLAIAKRSRLRSDDLDDAIRAHGRMVLEQQLQASLAEAV